MNTTPDQDRIYNFIYTKKEFVRMVKDWLGDDDLVEVSWPVFSTEQMTIFRASPIEEIEL